MGVDLTRFDFHVYRFLHSYNVRKMSSDEVGQYVLLLAECWVLGKGACIPDDPEYLAEISRSSQISPLVLKQFKPIEIDGEKWLRNDALYEEWEKASGRVALASEMGRKGNDRRWGNRGATEDEIGGRQNIGSGGDKVQNRPTQPVSTQPNQPNPTQSTHILSDAASGDENSHTKSNCKSNHKLIRTRYYSYFGIVHAHSEKDIQKYVSACGKYGEDAVLRYFDQWAQTAVDWLKPRRDNHGLNFFYPCLEEMQAGEELKESRDNQPNNQQDSEAYKQLQLNIAAEEENLRNEKKRMELERQFLTLNENVI
jgi:uncharacterized protein YdaU (DUF1376 family)